jgi:hypothetical protein
MFCPSCKSNKQATFPAEMIIHFAGSKRLANPGVWVFPTLVVCLSCGFLQSIVPAAELALLAVGSSETERVARRMVDGKPSELN